MGRRGQIIIICLGIASALVLPRRVFCYDSNVAHPNIAQRAGILFNKNSDQKLTVEQISWIMEGATAEDTPTRWLNHFYDPIHNTGLKGVQLSAKNWSNNPNAQTQFSLGDRSWQRALSDYKKGNFKQAYVELGHIIHLISDMTVPAHTRDDIHVIGDSYEQFVKNNWNTILPLIVNKIEFIEIRNESNVFDEAANYSNNNFYSDDTIGNSQFIDTFSKSTIFLQEKNIVRKYKLNDRTKAMLCRDGAVKGWQNILDNSFELNDCKIESYLVLTDYSTHLIPKAIGYSAGLIKLFLQEAQNEEVAKLPSARIGLRGYGDSVFGFVISAGGEMLDYLKSKFNPATQTVVSATQENLNEVIFEAEKEAENDNTADGIASLPRTGVAPRNDIRERSVDEVRPRAVEDQDDRQPTEILKQVQDDNVSQFSSTYSGGGSSSTSPSSAIDTVSSTSQHTPPPPPNLDQFFNGIIFTTTTEFNIYGTCSAQTTKIIPDPQIAEEHTAPSGTIWNYFAPLLPGHNYFSFISMDAESATSTSSSVAHIVRDNKPPAIPSINIQDQTSPTSTNLQIILASSDDFSPFIFFDLYFTSFVPTSSPSTTYTWQPLVTNTTTATFNLSTTRGQSYLFRSRAWDILNNTSPWSDELNSSTPINIDWSKEVVINEIAWAGTFADNVGKYDEWLELYNNTDQEINLKDWKIIVSDRSITFATNTYISARGYYLMERTDDSAVQNISADYIFTLASGLKNSGELLQLVNPEGEIIDEIDCSEGWFAGNTTSSESYPTMARVNSLAPGNDKNNWRTSRGPWLTAMVYTNGRLIFGSPREFNKEMKILSGTQIENELILDKNDGPYFLDNYTLPANSILRLDSGTEIYFPAYGYFYVNGNLISEGTEAEPVVFSPVPSTTMWANIVFNNTTATFAHTKFWRGNMEQVVQNDGALYAVSSTITLNHVSIWNSRKPGKNINSLNSILTVKNSSIGADVKNSNPNVNTVGIYAKGGEIDLDNVLFTNLNIGVDGGSVDDNFPELTINNMPEENFINIDYPWQPSNWLDLIALPEAPVVPVENQLIEPQDEIVASSSEQIFEPESTSSLQISA